MARREISPTRRQKNCVFWGILHLHKWKLQLIVTNMSYLWYLTNLTTNNAILLCNIFVCWVGRNWGNGIVNPLAGAWVVIMCLLGVCRVYFYSEVFTKRIHEKDFKYWHYRGRSLYFDLTSWNSTNYDTNKILHTYIRHSNKRNWWQRFILKLLDTYDEEAYAGLQIAL